VDATYARACLDYEPETGRLVWRVRPERHFSTARAASTWNSRYAGRDAGSVARCVSISIAGRQYKAHRLAWLLFYGDWPDGAIDHADGNPQNNAIGNLRIATNQQNQFNRGLSRSNTSGFKGVCWDKPRGRWRAQLTHNGRSVFLGHYATPEEAAAAYAEGAKRYAREFARTET
jgi:hypothetical protein